MELKVGVRREENRRSLFKKIVFKDLDLVIELNINTKWEEDSGR